MINAEAVVASASLYAGFGSEENAVDAAAFLSQVIEVRSHRGPAPTAVTAKGRTQAADRKAFKRCSNIRANC